MCIPKDKVGDIYLNLVSFPKKNKCERDPLFGFISAKHENIVVCQGENILHIKISNNTDVGATRGGGNVFDSLGFTDHSFGNILTTYKELNLLQTNI